ncbi:MotE family protein [Viridibacillus sp. NPDC093762]|uniref:MotE family protein n=1 Tax=Viridibacillus sp. NPDC093762 TaxID=3390720 RepID=UPI003D00A153
MNYHQSHITTKKSGDGMAKKNLEHTKASEVKAPSTLQRLFYWVIIPLLFTTAVLLIIAHLLNVNVFEKAKEWTSGTAQSTNEKVLNENDVKENAKQTVELKAQIQEKEAEIAQLQGQIEDSKNEKSKLVIEQDRLIAEIDKLEKGKAETQKEFSSIVSTFEKMTPKAAAPVIINMSDSEAIKILASLKPETLAKVLEKMPAKDAARYTALLAK